MTLVGASIFWTCLSSLFHSHSHNHESDEYPGLCPVPRIYDFRHQPMAWHHLLLSAGGQLATLGFPHIQKFSAPCIRSVTFAIPWLFSSH